MYAPRIFSYAALTWLNASAALALFLSLLAASGNAFTPSTHANTLAKSASTPTAVHHAAATAHCTVPRAWLPLQRTGVAVWVILDLQLPVGCLDLLVTQGRRNGLNRH